MYDSQITLATDGNKAHSLSLAVLLNFCQASSFRTLDVGAPTPTQASWSCQKNVPEAHQKLFVLKVPPDLWF